jgi:hypothetical protein
MTAHYDSQQDAKNKDIRNWVAQIKLNSERKINIINKALDTELQ